MKAPSTPARSIADSPRRGLFIALEGGDGSGKSTQARLLREHLERAGHRVQLTREPGGTDLAERIRSLVLDHGQGTVDSHTEALLFAAARSSHVREMVLPALAEGTVVVTDRYIDSSVAYQGAGRALGEEPVEQLNAWATDGLRPDLTVVLDAEPALAARRRAGRLRAPGAAPADRLESESAAFHDRIRASFLDQAARQDRPYLVLDASRPSAEIAAEVADVVLTLLQESS